MVDDRIPVTEEELRVAARRRVTGAVRVDKRVVEEPVPVEVELLSEEVAVRRLPADRLVPGPIPDRWDGDTLIISVVEEELVVERRYRLVEEVFLTRKRRSRRDRRQLSRRREEVSVERR